MTRSFVYSLLVLTMLTVVACGKKVTEAQNDSTVEITLSADVKQEAQALTMQPSVTENTFTFNGKSYRSCVRREPDQTLPLVRTQSGNEFVDNKVKLDLFLDNQIVVSKTFTKGSFSSVVDAEFLANAILEGFVFDRVESRGILFAASVCYPQTDLFVPVSVLVTPSGEISITQVELF